jgi:6,7-dimethyl-8-ribityllumazine synthase
VTAANPRILIVAAKFYGDIAEELVRGARLALKEAGADVETVDVPGAFEIPAAVAAAGGRYDGCVALGCVIRGETTHYDYVCGETARALMDLSVREGRAIGYGILTVENRDQAWARARVGEGDKGGDAARACLAMIDVRRRLGGAP